MNNFERIARDRKLLRLMDAIDAEIGDRVTGAQARAVADQLGAWPSEAWEQLASKAGVNPPSLTTIAEIVMAYQRRSQRKVG